MIKVTCDKCGKEIKDDFVLVRSDFYTVVESRKDDPVCFCANGDGLVFCEDCYSEFVHREED